MPGGLEGAGGARGKQGQDDVVLGDPHRRIGGGPRLRRGEQIDAAIQARTQAMAGEFRQSLAQRLCTLGEIGAEYQHPAAGVQQHALVLGQ